MYFKSRVEAGKKLAAQLAQKYKDDNCTVLALDDGGVMVAAQIASRLHTSLGMLLAEDIDLPQESAIIGGLSMDGSFSFSSELSSYDIDEFVSEYYNVIEQEKISKMRHMNEMLGAGGLVDKRYLTGHNVILASDGLTESLAVDLAVSFLKPIRIGRLIVATPMASIPVVDRMHVLADEIYCLNVIDSGLPKEHYYDLQDIPDHETIIKTIERMVQKWDQSDNKLA